MRYTTGNLLDVPADALVNTVNTVGVMGKGIALMFKEKFPENYRLYQEACEAGRVEAGHLMITENSDMYGPRWIINFPTKKHWRHPSKLEWIESGLQELRNFIVENKVRSIAIPPLGAGNGGLEWNDVRPIIAKELDNLDNVDVVVFEPTSKYQNVAKRAGVEKLTPARALIAEMIRRYWVLGLECTLLEVQKLAWFVEANVVKLGLDDPLKLNFKANRFGPYADNLRHMLNSLDGSYLQSDKRISDATPFDVIRFNDSKRQQVEVYFTSPEAKPFRAALQATTDLIDGFESPLGMELLATIDWLIRIEHVTPTLEGITAGIQKWPGGVDAAKRKSAIFEPRLIEIALERLTGTQAAQPAMA
ncbi:type II toxin-antitoxin system antitoxin DNA ADP-ribosyl glycohydrolase DarG [Sphingomonas aurantiaca]